VSDALWLQNLDPRTSTSIYDLETQHTSEMKGMYLAEWIFSPGGRYLSVFERRGRIYDRYTDVTYTLPVHSARVYRIVAYNWHPDAAWLVTVDHLCIAGDCPAILRYGVTNSQGSYWRELGDADVNWLPGQVDVSKLAPGTPESVLLAPEIIDRSVEFSYGSEDQTLQAVCDDPDETEMHIQNRETGDILYTLHDDQTCRASGGTVQIGVSPDGNLLAVGSPSIASFATLWDINTGKLLARFNCTCFEMHFSDDSKQLFTRASSAMLVWDVEKVLEQAAVR
jgi:WD40 repeat protein